LFYSFSVNIYVIKHPPVKKDLATMPSYHFVTTVVMTLLISVQYEASIKYENRHYFVKIRIIIRVNNELIDIIINELFLFKITEHPKDLKKRRKTLL
jgi:uncharacterized membrane-anchored protein YitT (DUF2179 family)